MNGFIRKLLVVAGLLAGCVGSASARGLHVDVNEPSKTLNPADTTCSFANPCSITNADAVARPADTVYVYPGVYSTIPASINNGTTYVNRIFYRGVGVNRTDAVFPNATLAGTFKRYQWLAFRGGTGQLGFGGPFVQVDSSSINANVKFGSSDDCVISASDFPTGSIANMMTQDALGAGNIPLRDTLRACTGSFGPTVQGQGGLINWRNAQQIVHANNNIVMSRDNTDGDKNVFIWLNESRDMKFLNNRWTFNNVGSGQKYGLELRDSCERNIFDTDTIIAIGTSIQNMLSSSGTYNTCEDNNWNKCVYLDFTTGYSFAATRWQNGPNADSATLNIFFSQNHQPLVMYPPRGGASLLWHNTIVGDTRNIDETNGLLATTNYCSSPWRGKVRFKGNLLADRAPGGSGSSHVGLYWLTQLRGGSPNCDSLYTGPIQWFVRGDTLQADSNYYAIWGYSGQPGDRSISWRDSTGFDRTSRPGAGTLWASIRNLDKGSTWAGPDNLGGRAGPAFIDSVATDQFVDLRLTAISGARGAADNGTDAGAVQFAADVTPPGTVADLSISTIVDGNIFVTFTAPGDDGTLGTATSYNIGYSKVGPVVASTWNLASTTHVGFIPGQPGAIENFALSGLDLNTVYYIAMKTSDEVPNTSLISNGTQGRTGSGGNGGDDDGFKLP